MMEDELYFLLPPFLGRHITRNTLKKKKKKGKALPVVPFLACCCFLGSPHLSHAFRGMNYSQLRWLVLWQLSKG